MHIAQLVLCNIHLGISDKKQSPLRAIWNPTRLDNLLNKLASFSGSHTSEKNCLQSAPKPNFFFPKSSPQVPSLYYCNIHFLLDAVGIFFDFIKKKDTDQTNLATHSHLTTNIQSDVETMNRIRSHLYKQSPSPPLTSVVLMDKMAHPARRTGLLWGHWECLCQLLDMVTDIQSLSKGLQSSRILSSGCSLLMHQNCLDHFFSDLSHQRIPFAPLQIQMRPDT